MSSICLGIMESLSPVNVDSKTLGRHTIWKVTKEFKGETIVIDRGDKILTNALKHMRRELENRGAVYKDWRWI